MTRPSGRPVEVIELTAPTRVPIVRPGGVEVVELAAPARVETVEVGGRTGSGGASRLNDLRDVEAPAAPLPASPAVLVRGPDNVFRPVAIDQVAPPQRGSVVHYLDTAPTGPPEQARAGDWVTVIAGEQAGSVYRVQES